MTVNVKSKNKTFLLDKWMVKEKPHYVELCVSYIGWKKSRVTQNKTSHKVTPYNLALM